MTQPKEASSLKDLPTPRSPAALDERIIAHARAAAPVQDSEQALFNWNGPWLSGVATTGVLVVAILIAVPTLRQQLPAEKSELASAGAETTLSQQYDFEEDTAPSRARKASVDTTPHRLEEALVLADSAPAISTPEPPLPPKPAQSIVQRGSALAGASYSTANRGDYQTAPKVSVKAKPTRKLMNGFAQKAAIETQEQASDETTQTLPSEQTLASLRACEKQSAGENVSDTACYDAVKKACPDCDWPPTLEGAVKAFFKEQAQ